MQSQRLVVAALAASHSSGHSVAEALSIIWPSVFTFSRIWKVRTCLFSNSCKVLTNGWWEWYTQKEVVRCVDFSTLLGKPQEAKQKKWLLEKQ